MRIGYNRWTGAVPSATDFGGTLRAQQKDPRPDVRLFHKVLQVQIWHYSCSSCKQNSLGKCATRQGELKKITGPRSVLTKTTWLKVIQVIFQLLRNGLPPFLHWEATVTNWFLYRQTTSPSFWGFPWKLHVPFPFLRHHLPPKLVTMFEALIASLLHTITWISEPRPL